MKIICDNCRTKYSIADEKVMGKVFKIRCKKCQNIIVVRGNQEQPEPEPALAATPDGAYSDQQDAAAAYQEAPEWHVVIDGEQVGPMTVAEVTERFQIGEINENSYIWKETFSDWRRLGDVEEFAEMAEATKVAPSNAAVAGPSAFGQPAEGWEGQPASGAAQDWSAGAIGQDSGLPEGWGGSTQTQDGFAGEQDDQGMDLFATYHGEADDVGLGHILGTAQPRANLPGDGSNPQFGADAATAQSDPGAASFFPSSDEGQDEGDGKMKGERNENSVLFSLSNLQALAMGQKSTGAPATADPAEGSGLIDIRSMAGDSIGGAGGRGDETPFGGIGSGLGGLASPVAAAPVLMPSVEEERPKWLLPLVLGLGVALLAMGGLVVFLVVRTPEPTVVASAPAPAVTKAASPAAPAAPAPATAPPAAATPSAAAPAATAPAAASTPEQPSAAAAPKAAPKARSGKRKRTSTTARRTPKRSSAPKRRTRPASTGDLDEPPPTAPRRRKRSGKKRGRDSLDDLIDGALSGSKKRPRKATKPRKSSSSSSANSNLPETLSRVQIQSGMRRIKPRIQSCFDRFKVPGLASVKVKISGSGRVSSATVKGVFAGTPTGACVQSAARSATFSKFKGATIGITYPFILR